ncbi:unnamed protein product [Prunus armeniaca]
METVGILVFYNGSWVHKDKIESYEGGEAKGIIVSRNITFSELVDRIYKITNADLNKYCLTLKYSVPLSSSTYKHLKVEDNDDVQYFLKYNTDVMTSKVTPLLATLKIIEGHGIYGCNGIVSIGSSNAPPAVVVRDRNEVIGDSGTENGVTGFNWKDWVEDVNFECVENIVADFCVPRNEEEAYSAPNVLPHRESNFQTSMVLHKCNLKLRNNQVGLKCIQAKFIWCMQQSEATFDLEQSNLGNVGCVFVVGNFLALGDFEHIKLDYMSLGLLNTIHFMNVI